MSNLVTIAVLQDAINNLGLPEKITRTQLEYWRAGSRAVIRALNDAIQAAPSIEGVAQSDQKQPESRANTGLNGVAQARPDGWPTEEMITAFAEVFSIRDQRGTFRPAFRAAIDAGLPTLLQNQQQIIPEIIPSAKQGDAPPSASPWIWPGDVPPPGQAVIEYWGAGEYQVSTNWDGVPSWYMLIPAVPNENEGPEAAAVPVPPADKAGVSGSEAPMSDKPACGAQSSECDPQAQREVA